MKGIRKFYGKGDLFVRAGSDTLVSGVEYKKGEVISFFENVEMNLGYTVTHKEAYVNKPEVSHTEINPYSFNVVGVENGKEVDKLFFNLGVEEEVSFSIIEKHYNCIDEVFLKKDLIPAEIKVYNKGKIIESEYFKDSNSVRFDGKFKELNILITYTKNSTILNFNRPDLGYFQLEGTVEGKFGDKEGFFNISIPTANLISEPEVAITESSSYNTTLSFVVIEDKSNPLSLNFIDV